MNYGYVCNEIEMTKEMERMVVIGREPVLKKKSANWWIFYNCI